VYARGKSLHILGLENCEQRGSVTCQTFSCAVTKADIEACQPLKFSFPRRIWQSEYPTHQAIEIWNIFGPVQDLFVAKVNISKFRK
jgi:hypothetical protein